jgi:DNA-binding NtrC family response regulator
MQALLLRQAGYGVGLFEDPQAALAEAAGRKFDLAIVDDGLPAMRGEAFLDALRQVRPDLPVIFVSGSLTHEAIVRLARERVAGIFTKPAQSQQLLEKIAGTLGRPEPAVRGGSRSPFGGSLPPFSPAPEPSPHGLAYEPHHVFGASDRFRELTHRLWQVRDFRSVLLLQGEAGSAFELFARELARISSSAQGPVLRCNAADFAPEPLLEALAPALLGAGTGTVVITGVEQFTAAQQQTLENLIEGRDVFQAFAHRFRFIVTATHHLAQRVDDGSFAPGLFVKISSQFVTLPPLRTMRADLVANAKHLIEEHQAASGAIAPVKLGVDATAWLEAQDWPGNYAQLSEVVKQALARVTNGTLDASALQAALVGSVLAAPISIASTSAELPCPGATNSPFESASRSDTDRHLAESGALV